MRLFIRAICIALIAIFVSIATSSPALAVSNKMEWRYVLNALQIMQGDWYDDNGTKVITIHDKYINGCEVLSAYDFAGGGGFAVGIFRIQERTGSRDIRIEWNIKHTPADYITINDNQTLHKTQNHFFESIGGIHLGMSSATVEQKLGKPSRILTSSSPLRIGNETYNRGWYYKSQGLIVTFNSKSIDCIILLKQSNLRFEKSGLSCASAPEDFARAYSMERVPSWPARDFSGVYSIGHGEYISFGKDMSSIMLTIYNKLA